MTAAVSRSPARLLCRRQKESSRFWRSTSLQHHKSHRGTRERPRVPRFRLANVSLWEDAGSLYLLLGVVNRRLGSRNARDRHAERAAGDVLQAGALEELDRRWIAAMLAAHAEADVGARGLALVATHLHELADALLVDRDERFVLQDLLVDVLGQELACVIARHTEGGLGQIVRAEAEELGGLGELISQ